MSQEKEILEGGCSLLTRENREMRSQVGKKDENERDKPIVSLLIATG